MKRRRPVSGMEELTDQDRRRMGDPLPRQLYRSGGSLVVAVPADVVDYLDARVGQRVWWYLGAAHEAIVSMSPRRVGGRPGGMHAARELSAARAEITRLRRRLAARPEAVYAEGVNEGRMRHAGELVTLGTKLDELAATVEALAARLPFGRRRHGRVVAQDARAPSPPRAVDAIPLPDLPSSPELLDGGDAASGAEPPGRPHDT